MLIINFIRIVVVRSIAKVFLINSIAIIDYFEILMAKVDNQMDFSFMLSPYFGSKRRYFETCLDFIAFVMP